MATESNTPDYMTGYYGIPGGRPGGNVHVIRADTGRPICGYRPHPLAVFQWCARRIELAYVECTRCAARADKLLLKAMADEVLRLVGQGWLLIVEKYGLTERHHIRRPESKRSFGGGWYIDPRVFDLLAKRGYQMRRFGSRVRVSKPPKADKRPRRGANRAS